MALGLPMNMSWSNIIVSIYLLGISAASIYSIYLVSLASGIDNPAIMFHNRNTNKDEEDLMNKVRTLLNYYKILLYLLIAFNGVAIVGLFLGAFKVVARMP